MKSTNLRSYLIGLLVMASVCSYLYVNTATISIDHEMKQESEQLLEEQMEQNMVLPEVQIVKQLLESSRKLIPSS